MPITLYLGNIGSGKTVFAVREMVRNIDKRTHYTDIIPTKPRLTPWIKVLKPSMIVSKELVKTIRHKDGTDEPVYNYSLNEDFWKKRMKERKSITIDECHKYLEARNPFSKVTRLFTDFLALARRVVEDSKSSGDMVFITQLGRRADVILREMANEVKYFVCHYNIYCTSCRASWKEDSEMPTGARHKICPACGSWDLQRYNHTLEITDFASIKLFQAWEEFNKPLGQFYYNKSYLRNISDYFQYYDTVQWSNMFSGL